MTTTRKNSDRELIDCVCPFKQYSLDVIDGVLKGFITPSTYGFEDYPCELTMLRWTKAKQKIASLL